jgi:phage-related protein
MKKEDKTPEVNKRIALERMKDYMSRNPGLNAS